MVAKRGNSRLGKRLITDGEMWREEPGPLSTPCWMWQRAKDTLGYGIVAIRKPNDRKSTLGAHRWVYAQRKGTVPDGLTLDHLCRNRACVNPDHLEPVSFTENVRRRPFSRLDPVAAQDIRDRSAAGESQRSIARAFGVSQTTVRDVIAGRTWKIVKEEARDDLI